MIHSFRHAGLREFWETGKSKKINSQWLARIERRLTILSNAASIEEISVPGARLHQLKGDRAGTWAVNVTGNWRITFRIETGEVEGAESFDVCDVDLEDYHGS